MRLIVGGLECSLVSALEPIVLTRADRHVESFTRYILQTTTTGTVESRPAQRLAVTTAVTHAQPAVLPQLALRAKATGRVNVSTEATSTNGTDAWHRAQQLDLREGLSCTKHQQPGLLLRCHRLIQDGVKLSHGGAQFARLYSGQHLFAPLT